MESKKCHHGMQLNEACQPCYEKAVKSKPHLVGCIRVFNNQMCNCSPTVDFYGREYELDKV